MHGAFECVQPALRGVHLPVAVLSHLVNCFPSRILHCLDPATPLCVLFRHLLPTAPCRFINAFFPGAVVERDEREEELCQGPMRVSDVFCARCAARIGWRFCRDLLPSQPNANQVRGAWWRFACGTCE